MNDIEFTSKELGFIYDLLESKGYIFFQISKWGFVAKHTNIGFGLIFYLQKKEKIKVRLGVHRNYFVDTEILEEVNNDSLEELILRFLGLFNNILSIEVLPDNKFSRYVLVLNFLNNSNQPSQIVYFDDYNEAHSQFDSDFIQSNLVVKYTTKL